jgi:hypothetical protein
MRLRIYVSQVTINVSIPTVIIHIRAVCKEALVWQEEDRQFDYTRAFGWCISTIFGYGEKSAKITLWIAHKCWVNHCLICINVAELLTS